jgi:hypothetical protein
MKDIEVTDDDVEAVGGFGDNKGGVLEIEKQAAGKA